jgi:hypothetical protein
MEIRMTERMSPSGRKRKKASVAEAVGRKARRPSWKMSGFGYLARGRWAILALSLLTV